MPVTPRGRSRTASTSVSPSKSNGRKQARIALEISDDDDDEIVEKNPAKKGRPSKAKKEEVDDDDDDDDDDVEAGDEYEVEAIRSHRPLKGAEAWNMEYHIKWKGYPEDEMTWEPETNIPRHMVDQYWKTQPSKSQAKKFEQVQKRKSRHDDDDEDMDDVEEVDESEDEEAHTKPSSRGKAQNGRGRASAASSKITSPAKKARMSISSRRSASSSVDDDNDEDDKGSQLSSGQRALEKVRSRFLDHYMDRDDWEDCVECIVNMQRSEDDSRLQSWVQFEESSAWGKAMKKIKMPQEADGRGPRIWVDNEVVNERCPQKVIKFYSQHIRFSNPRTAAR